MAHRSYSAWTIAASNEPAKLMTADFGGDLAAGFVQVKVTHCGLCYSDIAMRDNEWGITKYPLICGHEVVGVISAVGANVPVLKVGDRVGCSNMRNTCHSCTFCLTGRDNLCAKAVGTFSQGGFGEYVRMQHTFVFKLPASLASEHAAPLMCAGSTVYAPFKAYDVKPGQRVAVVGIGGLGHLAIQFARAWGTEVTALSSTKDKEAEARKFGAHHFICTAESKAVLKSHRGYFDFMLVTVTAELDWSYYTYLIRTAGTLAIVGMPGAMISVPTLDVVVRELRVVGSMGCSRANFKEMIDFVALHNVRPQVEVMPFSAVNEAIERVQKNQVRYRAVLTHPQAKH